MTMNKTVYGNCYVSDDDLHHIGKDHNTTLCDKSVTARGRGLLPATCETCLEVHRKNTKVYRVTVSEAAKAFLIRMHGLTEADFAVEEVDE